MDNPGYYPDFHDELKVRARYTDGNREPPRITRYLTQSELHQVALKLLREQDDKVAVIISILQPKECYVFVFTLFDWEAKLNTTNETIYFPTIEMLEWFLADKYILTLAETPIRFEPAENITFKMIYDSRYPFFFYSYGQKEVLDKFLPGVEFDYPQSPLTEDEYFDQLEKKNRKLQRCLSEIFPNDLSDLIKEYTFNQPERMKIDRFLERKFLHAILISQYLG